MWCVCVVCDLFAVCSVFGLCVTWDIFVFVGVYVCSSELWDMWNMGGLCLLLPWCLAVNLCGF